MKLQRILLPSCGFLFLSLSFFLSSARAEAFAEWDNEKLVLDNGAIRRVVSFGKEGSGISTISLKLVGCENEFVHSGSREFCLEIDGRSLDGSRKWELAGCKPASCELKGRGAAVTLRGVKQNTADIEIELTYLLYPGLPVIRKKLSVRNTGRKDIRLEAVDVENLFLAWGTVGSWIITDYARYRRLGSYIGNWDDPAVIVHDIGDRRGIVLGNEAPGITKRTTAYADLEGRSVSIGLTHPDQDYPFRKWLKPGESWVSPWVFITLYNNSTEPQAVVNGPVNDFVRRHMGIRLAAIEEKPVFVYNTWNPFRFDVSDSLVYQLAEAAAECGVEEFIIDDGWQTNYGDWEIDRSKFPNGLKPVFDHIKSLGMKPGLWLCLATAGPESKVFQEHPEWFVRGRDGKPANLHSRAKNKITACLSTGWYDYIKSVILNLVREHGLAYVKLDFAIAHGAYVYDKSNAGCYAQDHPLHRDREESFLVIYRRCMQLFDDLHHEAPELFIDCTYETWGAYHLVDYALVKHAEGDWLSNIEEKTPYGSLRVRHLAWWRSPAIPAAALVIGNLSLDDPGRELELLSLAGTLPIMLGDPRKVPPENRRKLKHWADWMRSMQEKHDYMLFRQDLAGFGKPHEGHWDGWARINNDTHSGGIIGVFRQGAVEKERTVTVPGLDPEREYIVRRGPGGGKVTSLSGLDLAEKGFRVSLPELYDAALFEIESAQ
ncbi:MAG: glycoside hydrolase family 36 protein [Gemmatimonadota bacterium]|nr:glycoside hydrolase family 36 protein [Gemmatimonadota bacterium]